MSKPILRYLKGSVLLFEWGEYSDHQVDGPFIALHDLDLVMLAQQYANGEEPWDAGPSRFTAWLVAHGHVLPVGVAHVHLGPSSISWEPEFNVVPKED